MSGLFLRLAAQATEQRGATLHSPARLPYQALPERMEPPSSALDMLRPSGEEERRIPTRPEALSPGVAPIPAPTSLTSESPQEHAPGAARSEDRAPLPPPSLRAMAVRAESGEMPDTPPQENTEVATPTRPVDRAPASIIDQPVPPPIVQSPSSSEAPQAPSVTRHEARPSLRSRQEQDGAVALPSPLLPTGSHRSAPLPSSAPASAIPAREPDEVHIHIGRIEVTAIHESKPASRASRKGAPPLSLDDYLARRKGDGL
jgi:hypothetical protein